MPDRRRNPDQANAATALALAGLLVIGLSLLGLIAVVLPFVRGIILIALLVLIPAAVHYLVWGWWLSQMKEEEGEAEDESEIRRPRVDKSSSEK